MDSAALLVGWFLACWPGDQVSRRGAMTGGFYDPRRSRMEAQRSKVQLVTRMEEDQGKLDKIVKQLEDILFVWFCV